MGETEKYARTIERREGWLCLDYANTAEWHASAQPTEHLPNYAALVAWALEKGVVTEQEAAALLGDAERRPAAATAVHRDAIDLREVIFRLFTAVAAGEAPVSEDLAALNAALAGANAWFQVAAAEEGFVWDWQPGAERLESMLWPVVRSAANLLTSEDLGRVGQCADDRGCGWLFLDTSRNRSRRWCSMEDCGNRAKARLHYRRQHEEG